MQRICPVCHVLFTPETRAQTRHAQCGQQADRVKEVARGTTKQRGLTGLHRRMSDKFKREGAACVYCGSTENITAGHIVARENGGANVAANYQPECQAHNYAKRRQTGA